MDTRAKAHWRRMVARQSEIQYRISGEPWPLWIGDRKVSRMLNEQVTDQVSGKRCCRYWDKRDRFHEGTSALVDWPVTKKAMKLSKRSQRHNISKHATGHCAVGKMMKIRKQWDEDKCPRCGEPEDVTHMLKCKGQRASEVWEKSMKGLRIWLKHNSTCPAVGTAICSGLQSWRNTNATPTLPAGTTFPGLAQAFDNQNKIGWQALLQGCPAVGWAEVQQAYLDWCGSRRTGKRWLSALIRKLWDIAWDQWEHRNGILHNVEDDLATRELDTRIRSEHAKGCDELQKPEQQLFKKHSLVVILKGTKQFREAWIARIEAGRRRAVHRRERREKARPWASERRALARWLGRNNTTNQSTSRR